MAFATVNGVRLFYEVSGKGDPIVLIPGLKPVFPAAHFRQCINNSGRVESTGIRTYGFRRGSFRDIWLSPATWWAYARLVAHGRRPRRPEQDVYHLGGDVLIDARGIVAWIYRSRHPADRPSIDEIVSRIDALAPRPR